MVGKLILESRDEDGSKITENLFYVTNSDTSETRSTLTLQQARQVDTAMRAINSLTQNTYYDTTIEYSLSINEWLAEE